MRWKPGGTPEAEKPPGMAEFSEGLKVAKVKVKAPMEATGKVSIRHVPISDPWKPMGILTKTRSQSLRLWPL